MSRHGYVDDFIDDQWAHICYRGAVKSAIRGSRGQAFLRELREALDDLPDKRLCANDLQRADGMVCAIGAVGKKRGIDMTEMDAEYATDNGDLSKMFDIAESMVREIEYENDDRDTFWWAEPERDPETQWPINERDENNRVVPVHKKNANGEPVDKNGLTREQFNARQDSRRWSRMSAWVNEHLSTAPRSLGPKES